MTDNATPSDPLHLRAAGPGDADAIAAIYNDAVRTTAAIWTEHTVSAEDRRDWIEARCNAGYAVVVAEADRTVVGYAALGPFRAFDGYKFTTELSIYVRTDKRGCGIGTNLLGEILARAGDLGFHAVIAGIEAENTGSIALHRKFGFAEVGRMTEVGRKFDRWLDLVFMQKMV